MKASSLTEMLLGQNSQNALEALDLVILMLKEIHDVGKTHGIINMLQQLRNLVL